LDVRPGTARALLLFEPTELTGSVPTLVAALRIDAPDDSDQQTKLRKDLQALLTKIGKPAVPALTRALDQDFVGGAPRSSQGVANGSARLAVIETLAQMDGAAYSVETVRRETLRVLARTEANDPFPAVREAARQARIKLQAR
jgi:hypothetical protein